MRAPSFRVLCERVGGTNLDFQRFTSIIYAGLDLCLAKSWNMDECPFPTLAAAPRSAHGSTRLQCAVRLYAMLGIRCTRRNRTG